MFSFISKLFTKKKKPSTQVACLALHELQSGDYRCIEYIMNEKGIQTIQSLGIWKPEQSKQYEYIIRHVHDSLYGYGTVFKDDLVNGTIQINTREHPHLAGHTIIQSRPLHDNYMSWVSLDTNKVINLHKTNTRDSIGTGLVGISELFGIPAHAMFAYVAFERYSTSISLLLGSHVIKQYTVPVGTSQLLRVISDLLSCPTEMARNILEKHGVLHTHYDHRIQHRLMETLAPLLEAISEVVNDFPAKPYQNSFVAREISGWIFAGSGSHIPGLAELISIVMPADQIQDINPKYKKMIIELPRGPHKSALPRYYTALGLAISGA